MAKIVNRAFVTLNAVVWVTVIWFPFARFFSIPNMHLLSKMFALICLLLPFAFLITAIVLFIRSRASAQSLKVDIALALISLLADFVLLGAFNEGLL
jgi:hypothetical protein